MPISFPTRPRWIFLPTRARTEAAPPRQSVAWLLPTFVFVAALVLACWMYASFFRIDRALWYNPYHDRNAHYLFGLKLATDIQNGHILRLLNDLNHARVWPPLHGMALATALLIGGRDYHLAVLPSLAAWVASALLGFLIARRAAPRGGNLAGLIAAIFIAASPAHRAYATDVMLESLGACLSLFVLYCYLLTVQSASDEHSESELACVKKARLLAVALLVLFLEKYNYWLLVVLALLAAEGWSRGRMYRVAISERLRDIDWRRWTTKQIRHPLSWIVVLLLLASVFIYLRGERPVEFWGHSISLYPPHNLIHIAYVLLFVRLARWWWRQGRQWARRLDPRLRQIANWLICPIALWFLLPKHLSYFLWYLSFADRAPHQHMDFFGGFRDYATWAVEDYHGGLICVLAAAVLCLLGLLSWRRLRPGGVAVLTLVLLASVLTPMHPNHKGRMLHSWIPAVWVTAGVGAAALVYGRSGTLRRPWLAGAVVIVVAGVNCPALSSPSHAVEGGPHAELPSMLEVTDAYLSDIPVGGRTLLLTSLPLKPMAQWTWLERFGNFDGLEEHWYGFGEAGDNNRRGFAHWLQTTTCDTMVCCESTIVRPGVDSGPECDLHAELSDILSDQRIFRLVRERELPHLACRVRIWRRNATEAGIVSGTP